MRSAKGFSLIELLIVVAIIGIIAAIAVPNLLTSRAAANEAAAISSVRTIITGEITYASTVGAGLFGTLTQLGTANILDAQLGGADPSTKSGYTFTLALAGPTPGETFNVTAAPTDQGTTGTRRFRGDQSGVILFTTDGTAPAATAGGSTKVLQ